MGGFRLQRVARDIERSNNNKNRISQITRQICKGGCNIYIIKLLGMRAPKLRELIKLAGVHTQAAAA